MSSGRDEWMSRWTEEDRKRNLNSYLGQIPEEFGGPVLNSYLGQIPEEFGGPVKGVSGKDYEQLELDLGAAGLSDKQFDASLKQRTIDEWEVRHNVTNLVFQAKAIIDTVMDSMGASGFNNDTHEFALWGASELLQKAADVLES
jgi:hypothetical protein